MQEKPFSHVLDQRLRKFYAFGRGEHLSNRPQGKKKKHCKDRLIKGERSGGRKKNTVCRFKTDARRKGHPNVDLGEFWSKSQRGMREE